MSVPMIGVCAAPERARWSVWDQPALLVPRSYVDAIQRAGGVALLIAPDPAFQEDPDPVLDRMDALLLIGGADIDPAAYGTARHPETKHPVPERDTAEIALTRRALARDVPLLAICRGMQLLNVACGGTLVQHLPEALGHPEHRRVVGTFAGSEHDVRLMPGSQAARAAGEERHSTRSHHHQGVARIGEGLEVTGRSVIDELPEAIEAPGRRFALGVQWHPEADERSPVIAALVAAARMAPAPTR
jgi:putative glutamine amidotransferase